MEKQPRQAYQTDANDEQWDLIKPLLPPKRSQRGRPRSWPMREILNAVFHIVRCGCAWRLMSHDLPPWQTVYGYDRQWRNEGTWEKIDAALVQAVRKQEGRNRQPSAAVIDSQSVKPAEGGDERGVDVYKQVNGCKRHIVVDTLGLPLSILVHGAGIPDGNGDKLTLGKRFERIEHGVHNRGCRLKLVWADAAYEDVADWVKQHFGWTLEIVRRSKGTQGFNVVPRRWVAESSFG